MSSTAPRHPGPLHHPRRREAEVKVEVVGVGVAAAGCHPEGVAEATTMEVCPGVGVAAAVEGAVVAVGVGVAAAAPFDEGA